MEIIATGEMEEAWVYLSNDKNYGVPSDEYQKIVMDGVIKLECPRMNCVICSLARGISFRIILNGKKFQLGFLRRCRGTFTDCLGRSPDGQLHRTKVLSRGSLSVRVKERVSANRLKLFEDPGCPEQLFDGFFIQMEGLESDVKVCGWDPKTLVLELDQVIPENVQIHSENIELCSTWEAPILGMKLILLRAGIGRVANLRMRLATTRCTNAAS